MNAVITELTADQMQDAEFAYQCDLEARTEGIQGEQIARSEAWELPMLDEHDNVDKVATRQRANELVARYNRGREVMATYHLQYSRRTTCPRLADGAPSVASELREGQQVMLVESGHIGAMAAYRWLIFSPRGMQLMSTTIAKQFSPVTDLPRWARTKPSIVALAERDLSFRCRVWDAKDATARRLVVREAEARQRTGR